MNDDNVIDFDSFLSTNEKPREPEHYNYRFVFKDGSAVDQNGYLVVTGYFAAVGRNQEFFTIVPLTELRFVTKIEDVVRN